MNHFSGNLIDGDFVLEQIRIFAKDLGFSQIGVAGVDLSNAEAGLSNWLKAGFHGSMNYMAAHGLKRARPAELVPGTVSVITARMNYLPDEVLSQGASWAQKELQRLDFDDEGVISLYARGRDYHKVLRARLALLQEKIADLIGPFGHRVFTDSAPVLEVELASRSGQGWRGRHTLIVSRDGGSMFFLGEIYVDFALPLTPATTNHCGACTACIDACPTRAIIAPYRLDARRCISYLTIEHSGAIDEEFRPLIGNRIYGCDDCQLACPWNKFAKNSSLPDFDTRPDMQGAKLIELFLWSEEDFLQKMQGSPIRRIGHAKWLRNIATSIGCKLLKIRFDDPARKPFEKALLIHKNHPDAGVYEHVNWALNCGVESGADLG